MTVEMGDDDDDEGRTSRKISAATSSGYDSSGTPCWSRKTSTSTNDGDNDNDDDVEGIRKPKTYNSPLSESNDSLYDNAMDITEIGPCRLPNSRIIPGSGDGFGKIRRRHSLALAAPDCTYGPFHVSRSGFLETPIESTRSTMAADRLIRLSPTSSLTQPGSESGTGNTIDGSGEMVLDEFPTTRTVASLLENVVTTLNANLGKLRSEI